MSASPVRPPLRSFHEQALDPRFEELDPLVKLEADIAADDPSFRMRAPCTAFQRRRLEYLQQTGRKDLIRKEFAMHDPRQRKKRKQVPQAGPKAESVIQAVEHEASLPYGSILSGSQQRDISHARAAVCARLRAFGWSQSRIGQALGMHHSSVSIAIRGGKWRTNAVRDFDRIPVPDESGVWAI